MPTGQTRRYVPEVCACCGKKFERRTDAKKREFTYCSNPCMVSHLGLRKHQKTRTRLLEALEHFAGKNFGTGDLVKFTGYGKDTIRRHLREMREEQALEWRVV